MCGLVKIHQTRNLVNVIQGKALPYMNIGVYSTLAELVVEEERKGNPDTTRHTQIVQICKHKANRILVAQP